MSVDPSESPQVQPESSGSVEGLSKDVKMWAMFCHLAGFCGIVVPFLGGVLGSLIVWQIKKEEHPFIDQHGKEAFNFQITALIAGLAGGGLMFCIGVLGAIVPPLALLMFVVAPLLFAVAIAVIVFMVIAAMKANNGEDYRYPVALRLIK